MPLGGGPKQLEHVRQAQISAILKQQRACVARRIAHSIDEFLLCLVEQLWQRPTLAENLVEQNTQRRLQQALNGRSGCRTIGARADGLFKRTRIDAESSLCRWDGCIDGLAHLLARCEDLRHHFGHRRHIALHTFFG